MDYATQNISQLWDCVVWLSNNQGCDYSCGDNGSNRYPIVPIVMFFSQELKIQLRSTTWVTSFAFREMGRGNCWWSANVTKLRNPKLHLRIQTDTTDTCTSRVFVDWLWFVSVFVQGNMLDLYNLDGHRPFCYQMPGAGTWRRLAEDCSFACHEESRCWHRMSWHRVGNTDFQRNWKHCLACFYVANFRHCDEWFTIHFRRQLTCISNVVGMCQVSKMLYDYLFNALDWRRFGIGFFPMQEQVDEKGVEASKLIDCAFGVRSNCCLK